ncbi:uncharacterized protein PAC_16442 [Phialocephala subalpina]|uniref:Apple domain-containing protein n=1 Tax=Phialocephala subalpina TaxID=576137 RepID=A0A1L7XNA1_9HELO|nr:uncharacterized protein PAC_16442 [Phialocephala subalpina]
MAVRDVLPRHTRGYLWITFLVGIFMLMALSENGVFSRDSILPNPGAALARANQKPIETESRYNDVNVSMGYKEQAASTTTPILEYTTIPESPALKSAATSIPENPHADTKTAQKTFNGLDPKDVVILVKTGATSIWRRMPAHMSTTLGNPALTPNVVYYSDSPDNINGNPVIDVLANVSSTLKSSPDFELYTKSKEVASNNLYLESGSMEGDFYLPGGWRLDKYKFVPMFQHVSEYMPGKKWYVYMEDDNYFFWEMLYSWLGTLDHTKPLLIGSPAFRLGEDFAHGGSGFAISGQALKQSFGIEKDLASKFESYAQEQCCGDQVLSHVLHSKGVERYKDLDGGGWAALQSLPHWRIGFGTWNWCSPIMNIHKVHQSDISRLSVFQRDFYAREGIHARLRYKDIYLSLAKPNINAAEKSEWDNYATAKTFASSYDPDTSGETKKELSQKELEKKPWYSKESCRKACGEWEQCLSWKYADDNCALDHTAAMGQRIDAGIRMVSGWMLERIEKLEAGGCVPLDF